MKKELNPAIAIAAVVIVVLIAGYFLFMHSDKGAVAGVAQTKTDKKEDAGTAPPDPSVAK